jgi:hypothetical protein
VNALNDEPSETLDKRIGDETWNHYPEHTTQVLEWLAGPAKGDEMTPAQISAKYERAVADGLALFQRIPEDRRQEPGVCGIWSAKDLLGHLAFWDGFRLSRIDAEMAGNPIPSIDDEAPYDRTNSEQAALRSSWSWEMAFDEFTSIRDRLVEVLRVPSQHDQRTAGNHWDTHRADIEAWLAGNPVES